MTSSVTLGDQGDVYYIEEFIEKGSVYLAVVQNFFFENVVPILCCCCCVTWRRHCNNKFLPHYNTTTRKGTVFHESRGKHYSDSGFSEGDILGIMIDLPEKNPVSQFPPTYKDKVGSVRSTLQICYIPDCFPLAYCTVKAVEFAEFLSYIMLQLPSGPFSLSPSPTAASGQVPVTLVLWG